MRAAASIGPAASPLPLYYAVSQAGRAILAVRERDNEVVFAPKEHHGLTVLRDSVPQDDLMAALVRPMRQDDGQFQRVASAVASPVLGDDGVAIGALLASLPEPGDEAWNDDRWPQAAALFPLMDFRPGQPGDISGPMDEQLFRAGVLRVAVVADDVRSAQDLGTFATDYPSLVSRHPQLPASTLHQAPEHRRRVEYSTPAGLAIEVHLTIPRSSGHTVRAHAAALDEIAPQHRWRERRWLRPTLEAGAAAPPSPLMTWWAASFALSMLARYSPTAWVRALDLDISPIATVLERTLDLALAAVPHHVFEAVFAVPLLLPPGTDTPTVGR